MRAAAGGGFIVVLRNEFRDCLGEFGAERRRVRRRPEPPLGIHRQGRQAFARLFRTTNELGDLPDHPCAQGDEIARREPINFPIGINRYRSQGARGVREVAELLPPPKIGKPHLYTPSTTSSPTPSPSS